VQELVRAVFGELAGILDLLARLGEEPDGVSVVCARNDYCILDLERRVEIVGHMTT
jgi:hypothetical protein